MRVERLVSTYALDVRWTHFPLHPETPEEGLTLEQLFAGRGMDIPAAKARMEGLMRDEGLDYGNRTMTFNSRLAQEVAVWAVSEHDAEGIHTALFRAYFVEGKNLALPAVLKEVAEGLGLDGVEAEEVLRSRRYRQAVDEDWQRSAEHRVTGVPTFRIGDQYAVGAQPFETLERIVVLNLRS